MSRRSLAVFAVAFVVAAGMPQAAEKAVSQKGRLFNPGVMRVKAGEVVVFKNDDTVTHHVYSATKGHEFDLPTTKAGEDSKHAFAKPGRVDVRCGLHPGMRLVVTVE